jgi:hypothetical protein
LTSFTIAVHCSRSCDFCLQFLKPIVFKPSSTESSHLTADLPTRRGPSGWRRVNLRQGFRSRILECCPSHLNRSTLNTFTISGSLQNV